MKVPFLDLRAQYSSIKQEINEAVFGVLESGRFILGEEVSEFEKEIASFCGAEYAVGVASGTDALLLALQACGIEASDEVITTPFTFVATAEVIARLGGKPVFADIDPETFNIDPLEVEKKINKKTRAIIPVHLYGQSVDMKPILELARKHKLAVIEDAAQALGAEFQDRRVGGLGDAGALSFFPTKVLGGCGDAGMVVTNNRETAERVRVLRVHGSASKYDCEVFGYNSRLDGLQAAILRVKLKKLDEWLNLRIEKARVYDRLLADIDVTVPAAAPFARHIYNSYVIRARNRDELRASLTSKDIGTFIYYPAPLHLQGAFRYLGHKKGDFPTAERASAEVLAIPIFPELTDIQQEYTAGAMREFLSR